MRGYSPIPPIESAPDVLDGGHLWLLERPTGPIIEFRMDESGLLTFGTDGDAFETPPPWASRAVTHVRDEIDRDALRAGVTDVTAVHFYGIATRNEGIDYDWGALPPFLGLDVWAEPDGRFVAPDVAERVVEAIGLSALPAYRKELPADHFDPDRVAGKSSHWRDGPAAAIIVRNKAGGKALLDSEVGRSPSGTEDVESVVRSAVTAAFRDDMNAMPTTLETADPDAMSTTVFERTARRRYHALAEELDQSPERIRTVVERTVRSELRERRDTGSGTF